MKIVFEFNDETEGTMANEHKAKRMLSSDDAFMMLSEIEQQIRNHFKHDNSQSHKDLLEEIRTSILESNLLDLWR